MTICKTDRRPRRLKENSLWAASVRQEALSRTIVASREARRVFDRELTPQQQMNAVREIVETRTSELCRVYPGIVDVSFGFRLRRDRSGKRQRIVPQPCVRFLVARKWDTKRPIKEEESIPSRLLTYCTVGVQRKLCAVPTDIEDSRLHEKTIAHGTPQAITVQWKDSIAGGVINCLVERDRFPEVPFAVGCRHVLSLSALFFNSTSWGASVRVDGGNIIGLTRAIAGILQEAPSRSFDAQLFEVTDLLALRDGTDGTWCMRYATSIDDMPAEYQILTPHGILSARFVESIPRGRPLYRIGNIWIAHDVQLIRSQPKQATKEGDSGSPVVTKDGEMLLGMHVAGINEIDENGVHTVAAYMIPVWHLLDPANYSGVGSEKWKLNHLLL